MGKIQWFRNYIQSIEDTVKVNNVKTINNNKVLVEKEQIERYLNNNATSDNLILVGVLPDFGGKGNDADEFKLTNITQILVLSHTVYSDNDDGLLDIYEETYLTLEAVLKKILDDSLSCTELRFLNTAGIKIEPVYDLASCNGWKLMLNFDMFV